MPSKSEYLEWGYTSPTSLHKTNEVIQQTRTCVIAKEDPFVIVRKSLTGDGPRCRSLGFPKPERGSQLSPPPPDAYPPNGIPEYCA